MNMADDRIPLEWDQEHGMYVAEMRAHTGASRAVPADNTESRITYLTVERRSAAGEDGTPSRLIGGLAAVFNSPSRLIPSREGPFVERVLPSFFDHDAAGHWPGPNDNGVVCRYNHKDEFLLGSSQSGTLQLRLDGRGLDYTVDVPRSREDVLEGVERRDIAASSFTFGLPDQGGDDWVYTDGVTQRTLVTGTLVDVAPVSALAAYPNANVALRSLATFLDVPEEDVAAAAAQYELRRFFVRTDQAPPVPIETPVEAPQLELDLPQPMSPAVALMHMQGRRYAEPVKSSQ
jgi:phage head maturation protease